MKYKINRWHEYLGVCFLNWGRYRAIEGLRDSGVFYRFVGYRDKINKITGGNKWNQ